MCLHAQNDMTWASAFIYLYRDKGANPAGLPDFTNKNTGHPIKFEFQQNNEYIFIYFKI